MGNRHKDPMHVAAKQEVRHSDSKSPHCWKGQNDGIRTDALLKVLERANLEHSVACNKAVETLLLILHGDGKRRMLASEPERSS